MKTASISLVTILIAAFSLVPAAGSQMEPPSAKPVSTAEERRLTHDGIERVYRIHVPESYDATLPAPLVLALHGGRGTGRSMERLTGFSLLADSEGFIVVYPDGYERQWNDGRNIERYASHRENIDDVGFINSLIDHLTQILNIDADRVYLTGMSNGALFAHRIACEMPEKIAAIAPVEGTILERWTRECQPSRPVPVCIIKGLEAPLFEKESKRLRASDTARFWASHNECSPTPTVEYEADTDPLDGTRVRREVYDCGTSEREVVFYAIEGGGHTWPGGWQYYPEDLIGRTSRDIDATRRSDRQAVLPARHLGAGRIRRRRGRNVRLGSRAGPGTPRKSGGKIHRSRRGGRPGNRLQGCRPGPGRGGRRAARPPAARAGEGHSP
jgi:polyhydroxybutyrate depolymerase